MRLDSSQSLRFVEADDGHGFCFLDRAARFVFGVRAPEEDEIRDLVEAAQCAAADAPDDNAVAEIAFFLTAWGAEKIATQRIAHGDLGIDEPLRRLAAFGATVGEAIDDGPRQAALGEYQVLADEILMDTLAEFREFGMVVLYSGQRDEYARRWAAGLRRVIDIYPHLARNSRAMA